MYGPKYDRQSVGPHEGPGSVRFRTKPPDAFVTSRTVDGVQVMVVVLRFVVSFVSTSNVAAIVAFATSGRGTSVPSSARVPERIVGTLTPVHADAGRAFGTKGAGAECVGALDPMVASVADRRRVPMARRPTAPQRRRIGMATPPTRSGPGRPRHEAVHGA